MEIINLYAYRVGICPTTPPIIGCDTRSIFKQITAGLNSEFSFSETGYLIEAKKKTKTNKQDFPLKEDVWANRTDGFMPFQKRFATSRIWTQVTDFISYDDNRYAKTAFQTHRV